ncbi:MAG: cytochrome P460 family protein [Thermoanaerobaculum sp.]|nr:cytochrome P460 family protein [Thermoanaerobaculum sp.]MDW7968036.1 cytochrome P460 family protein [Thermoanaerobaculum sp.]
MHKALIPLAAAVALLGAGQALQGQGKDHVAYPQGYRSWYHVKTMVLQPGHPLYDSFGGIHHVYANEKARKGLQTGTFDKGAVFVFDLLEAQSEENALTEGARKVLAVMERDDKRFAATGGWGFEAFAQGDPTRRVVTNAKEQCFSCHESQVQTGFVFSRWRP